MIIAGVANLAIAAAKAAAGVLGGSAAMLSEAAHSVADTVTEVLLFTALRAGVRPADARHPFGYGKANFFWAFLAAVATLVAGAGFSITHGLHTISHGEEPGDFTLSYLVLGISFVIEAVSFGRAARQVRREAQRWRVPPLRYLRHTPDTAVKAVTLEDTAALIGLVLAAAGLGLTEVTGSPVWDGLASVAIGLLLVAVALVLARANGSLLVGRALPGPLREEIRAVLEDLPTVEAVGTLLTMQLGPRTGLIAAKINFRDDATGARIEAACEEAEFQLRAKFPGIEYIFLDPSPDAKSPG